MAVDECRWAELIELRGQGSTTQTPHWVYAVRTTGIYCRPGCPSPSPLRRNVRFFAGPLEAQAAGYRACKRCGVKSEADLMPQTNVPTLRTK